MTPQPKKKEENIWLSAFNVMKNISMFLSLPVMLKICTVVLATYKDLQVMRDTNRIRFDEFEMKIAEGKADRIGLHNEFNTMHHVVEKQQLEINFLLGPKIELFK